MISPKPIKAWGKISQSKTVIATPVTDATGVAIPGF